jgi:hypothetical protein
VRGLKTYVRQASMNPAQVLTSEFNNNMKYYLAKTPFTIVKYKQDSLKVFKKQIEFDTLHSIIDGKNQGIGMYLQPKKDNPNARPIMPTSSTSTISTNSNASSKIKQQFIYVPASNSFLPIETTFDFSNSVSLFDYTPLKNLGRGCNKNSNSDNKKQDEENEEKKEEHEKTVSQDYCHICSDGGKLLCCDLCDLVWHLKCTGSLEAPGEDETWACPSCTKGSDYLPDTKSFLDKWKKHSDEDVMKNSNKKRKLISTGSTMDIVPLHWYPKLKTNKLARKNKINFSSNEKALLDVKKIDFTPISNNADNNNNNDNANIVKQENAKNDDEDDDDGVDAYDIFE